MLEEQYGRSAGPNPAHDGVATPNPSENGVRGPGVIDSVPSDQLWRAAVSAARQAAMTAAELRRALEEGER